MVCFLYTPSGPISSMFKRMELHRITGPIDLPGPLELPFSLALLGTRFRTTRYSQRLLLEDGSQCNLNNLCDRCTVIFRQSRLVRGSTLYIIPSVEYFTLHQTVEDLVQAVNSCCHLCTSIWSHIKEESKQQDEFDRKYKSCPVFIRFTICYDVGAYDVLLMAIVAPSSDLFAKNLTWDEWDYGMIPAARLVLEQRQYRVRGKIYSMGDESSDRYQLHEACRESYTGSAAHMTLVKNWLKQCIELHGHCTKPRTDFAPKRLINIDFQYLRL